jgi:hypothetical protein
MQTAEPRIATHSTLSTFIPSEAMAFSLKFFDAKRRPYMCQLYLFHVIVYLYPVSLFATLISRIMAQAVLCDQYAM